MKLKIEPIRIFLHRLNARIRKLLQQKLTFMILPHTAVKPVSFHFSFSFLAFLIFFWTGLTSWATWSVFTNIDYWNMKVNHQIMKLKVHYFATELRKSREVLDQVREADIQLRQLLGMKNRKSIIEGELTDKGKGGPSPIERSILQKTVNKRLWEITEEEIRYESEEVLRESRARLQSFKEVSELIAFERGLFRSMPQGWPTEGRMTSHFGHRLSPIRGSLEFHSGIDIANERGTPVRATADGIVQHANWEGGYGRLVILDHGFGYVTYYGHNSVIKVNAGERVRRGQVICYMGSSGSSTGDHSHYEVWYQGRPVNPWKYLAVQSPADSKLRSGLP